jgi:hypothetical protein
MTAPAALPNLRHCKDYTTGRRRFYIELEEGHMD